MTVSEQINKILNYCKKRNSFIYEGEDIFSKIKTVFRANNIKDYLIKIDSTTDYIEISISFDNELIYEIWNINEINKF